MNRRMFLMGVAGAAACTRRSAPRLNVYNWSDYVAPDTVPNFEREFGVSVRYGTYESIAGDARESDERQFGLGRGVSFGRIHVSRCATSGCLRRCSTSCSRISTRSIRCFSIRRGTPSSAGAFRTCTGPRESFISKGLAPEPRAWADLWDARLRGKITMLDDPPEVFGACLKKIGDSLNTGDPKQLRDAQAQAIAQKPLLRAYLNAEVRDQLVAGDVAAAQAWAVTAGQAIAAAPDKLAFVLPAEGFARYADTMAILRESRRAELAHKFIDYLLRPEVGAAIVKATQTATANAAALKLCQWKSARIRCCIRRLKFWRGANGLSRSRLRHRSCGIDCGLKLRARES